MTDPSTLLKAADPLREESVENGLTPVEAQAIRRAMIAAIPHVVDAQPMWRHPLVVAVAAAGLVASVTGIVGHRLGSRPVVAPGTPPMQAHVDPSGGGERRQLQFSTPGGTRIIWIFDESLRLQEPMP